MKRSFTMLGLSLAAAVLPLAGAGPAGAASPSTPPTASSAIQHVVVMTQGSRTFDNYFGDRAGVDGIPTGSCQLASRISQPHCIRPHALTPASEQVPLLTTAAAQVASINRGGMNGFVRAQTSRRSDGTAANAYFRHGSLPLLDDVAARGVLFDHWFSGVPGGTVANRLFAVTAKPAGDPLAVPTGGLAGGPPSFHRGAGARASRRGGVHKY